MICLSNSFQAGGVVIADEITRAYIGPGSGLASLGAFLALIAALALMGVGFILYPAKRLARMVRERRARSDQETAEA